MKLAILTLQGELQEEEDNSNDEDAHCQQQRTPAAQPLKLIPKVMLHACTTDNLGGDFADPGVGLLTSRI